MNIINYKLIYTYIKIKEKSGLIENNSTGIIQIKIMSVDGSVISEKTIEPHGKMVYSLKDGENIYGKSVNRIYAIINVLSLEDINIGEGGSLDPNGYYTKSQVDEKLNDKIDKTAELTEVEAMDIINKYKGDMIL